MGGICKLLKNYHEDLGTRFRAPAPKHPVIVLIDNDSGADSVYGAIAGITKKPKPNKKASFIHVTGNLYVVPTPQLPGLSKTAIEDFFDASTLATVVNGGTFSRENNYDGSKHYGKATFAHEVVAKNASVIDFKNFAPLLERIVAVIGAYEAKLKAK